MPNVVVYYTDSCPYCRMVKAFLERRGVAYRAINVGRDQQAAREMIERSDQYGVPVTTVDDEVIIGFDTRRLSELFGEDRAADVVDVLIVGAGPGRPDGRRLLCAKGAQRPCSSRPRSGGRPSSPGRSRTTWGTG